MSVCSAEPGRLPALPLLGRLPRAPGVPAGIVTSTMAMSSSAARQPCRSPPGLRLPLPRRACPGDAGVGLDGGLRFATNVLSSADQPYARQFSGPQVSGARCPPAPMCREKRQHIIKHIARKAPTWAVAAAAAAFRPMAISSASSTDCADCGRLRAADTGRLQGGTPCQQRGAAAAHQQRSIRSRIPPLRGPRESARAPSSSHARPVNHRNAEQSCRSELQVRAAGQSRAEQVRRCGVARWGRPAALICTSDLL
jgi:hypothetical protein